MAGIEWFRWYHGTTVDPKWRVVARRADVPLSVVIAVWAAVLEHASEADERGTIDGLAPEVVAAALDIEPDQVTRILEAMQGLVLDGSRLTGWERRQPKREDDSAERVRRHREKQRTQRAVTQPSDDVTQCNAPVTHRNADCDSGNATKRLEKRRGKERRECSLTPSSLRSAGGASAPQADANAVDDGVQVVPLPSRSGDDQAQALARYRGEAVQIILDELWQSTRDRPPGRFGRDWSLDRELSIWRDLVKRYDPEEVNGAMRVMRRVGGFGDLEPLSLLLFRSREPRCRDLWQRCLSFHRKQVEHEASKKAGVIRVEVVRA